MKEKVTAVRLQTESVNKAFETVSERFDRIDLLINNAVTASAQTTPRPFPPTRQPAF